MLINETEKSMKMRENCSKYTSRRRKGGYLGNALLSAVGQPLLWKTLLGVAIKAIARAEVAASEFPDTLTLSNERAFQKEGQRYD